MIQTLTLLSCLLAQADRPQTVTLEQQITNAVTDALADKGEPFKKLAVVVTLDDRAPAKLDAPQIVTVLHDLLEDSIVATKRDVVDRDEFSVECKRLDLNGALKPADIARLKKLVELDGAIGAIWSQRNDRQTVRLVLLAPDRVVWTKTILGRVGDEIATGRKTRQTPNGNAARDPPAAQAKGPPQANGFANGLPGIIGSGGLIPGGASGSVAGAASATATAGAGTTSSTTDKPAGVAKNLAADGGAKGVASASTTASSSSSAKSASTTSSSTSANQASTANQSTPTGTSSSDQTNKSDSGTRAPANVPELNRKVLEFAANHLGQQVGNGECWTLAAEALKYANAQPARGYTFGREMGASETAVPGDIMQFSSCRFQGSNFTAIMGLPDHTAIVYAVDGNKITFIHQNFGSRMVTLLSLDMTTRTSGSYTDYRPLPKDTGE